MQDQQKNTKMARAAIREYQNKRDSAREIEEKEFQRTRISLGDVARMLTRAEVKQEPDAMKAEVDEPSHLIHEKEGD